MAQAEFHEVMSVEMTKLFSVITRYEDYPQFVDGCTAVKVERKGPGKARVTYNVSMMKDIVYTLDLVEEEGSGQVEWELVDSDAFKKNTGKWALKAAGNGKTDVYYSLDVEFKIPVPGFILNRLVKGSLPSMVKSFVEQAKRVS